MQLERCIRHATLGLALFGSACTEPNEPEPEFRTCLDYDEIVSDVPDLPLVYTTEHLDVHITDDRFLCAGSAVDYERHVQYVAAELGVEIQRRMPVYVMKFADTYCPNTSACVTRDGVVFATKGLVYHELAHGVACEIRTGVPAILAEGLAVTFEPSPNDQGGMPQEFAEVHFSGADGGWVFEARFDCEDESTLGPYEKSEWVELSPSPEMYQSFLIEIPEPGTYRLERSDDVLHEHGPPVDVWLTITPER